MDAEFMEIFSSYLRDLSAVLFHKKVAARRSILQLIEKFREGDKH